MHLHRDGGGSGHVPGDEGRVGPAQQDMEGEAGGVVSTAAFFVTFNVCDE